MSKNEDVRICYSNIRVGFDIETTSYYDGDQKKAIVYTYTFSVNGEVTVLRTADAFLQFLKDLQDRYTSEWTGKDDQRWRRMIAIYVHNLPYEFQFIRQYLQWDSLFAIANARKIARAIAGRMEFRCSLMLTNKSLASVGKEVGIAKMEGDLDYSLIRHSETPLTEAELGYIHNDVLVIDALLQKKLEKDTMKSIPMTKTGYVRRDVRTTVIKDIDYRDSVRDLTLTADDYRSARQAFSGGYTHANALYMGKVVSNVAACDLASSYPASLAQFQFPMSQFTEVDPQSFEEYRENSACLVEVAFTGISSRYPFPLISESKALEITDPVVDNGRVFMADYVRVLITEVDFEQYLRCYEFESYEIISLNVAVKQTLPSVLLNKILGYYRDKTELKGVAGMEEEYALSKENVNSIYGMMATDPLHESFVLEDNMLKPAVNDLTEELDRHNRSRNRFLYYPWGAWVTAYSRSVLLTTIFDMCDAGIEVLYCDTDSIYYVESKLAGEILDRANDDIRARIASNCSKLDASLFEPADPKGIKHHIGLFEEEDTSDEFKTLGAKRYAKVIDGKLSITTAGLSKKAAEYVENNGGLDFYTTEMVVPKEFSGRNTLTYSDEVAENMLVDYMGNPARVHQAGFIHMEGSDYKLTVSEEYMRFAQESVSYF